MTSPNSNVKQYEYHKKDDVIYNRPAYREARWERAVKVYTINNESRYLIIQNIPSIKVEDELIQLFSQFGRIEKYEKLEDYPRDKFTDVYWLKYERIQSARFGKKKLDNHSFFGSQLHVCYAPEFETVDDVRRKLQERKKLVLRKCEEYRQASVSSDKPSVSSDEEATPTSSATITYADLSPQSEISQEQILPPSVVKDVCESQEEVDKTSTSSRGSASYKSNNLSEFPRIASHNASLPVEIQKLETKDVYSSDFLPPTTSIAETITVPHPIAVQNQKSRMAESSTSLANTDRTKSNPKRIVWKSQEGRNIDPSNSWGVKITHPYTATPGAWDPYRDTRVKNSEGAPPTDAIEIRDDIRERLTKTAEVSRTSNFHDNKICPLQLSSVTSPAVCDQPVQKKKRKNDGRIRI